MPWPPTSSRPTAMPRAPPRWAGHCVRWHNPAACAFVCAPTLAHCPAHHPSIPPQHTTPALCPLAHPCVQVGSEVRGNNTAADADGTAAKPFVFPYPYTSAATLWFKVTVVVGTTRSDASELSSAGVVVGECAGCCPPRHDAVASHGGELGKLAGRSSLAHTCTPPHLHLPTTCMQAPLPRRACPARWAARTQPPSASLPCPRLSSTL